MNKNVFGLISILLISILLIGCRDNTNKEIVNSSPNNDRIKIGFTFESFVIERWQRDRDIFVSTANELGADVYVQSANGSVDEQIEQIKYFADKRMDVLVIVTSSSDYLDEAIQYAKYRGVKVIAYDRLIKNADVDLYISIDSETVGRLMAETIVNNVPKDGKISIILGPETDNNVVLLEKGINSALDDTEIQVVYKDYAEGWLAEEGFSAVNTTLEITDSFDGIICGNDDIANHAIRALSENRLAGEVVVVGQDADLIACQRIVEGIQTMTVYKPINKLATRAAESAIKLANDEKLDTDFIIHDGINNIPYIKLEPVAVTKENIDQVIIDSGFHLREDVYINITQ